MTRRESHKWLVESDRIQKLGKHINPKWGESMRLTKKYIGSLSRRNFRSAHKAYRYDRRILIRENIPF